MKLKKKKMIAIVAAMLMALSMAPASVFAADATVSNETELRTNIATSGTITLSGSFDITGNKIVIQNGADVTLKANSPVTITTSVEDVFEVSSGSKLTLGQNITINSTDSILYANGGTINVAGAVLNSSSNVHNLGFAANGGKINVTAGSVNGTGTAATLSIKGAGSAFNITGGAVTSAVNTAISVKNNATATVNGGTVETRSSFVDGNGKTQGFSAIWAYLDGVAYVNGGAVKANGGYAVDAGDPENNQGNGTIYITGGTLSTSNIGVVNISKDGSSGEISGGTFTGTIVKGDGSKLEVTGGKFSDDSVKPYIKAGYELNADGTVVVAGADKPAAPLDDVPKTGDNAGAWGLALAAIIAAGCFVGRRAFSAK